MYTMKTKTAAALSLSLLALTAGSLAQASEVNCATVQSETQIRTYPINPLTSREMTVTLEADGSVSISGKGKTYSYNASHNEVQMNGASGLRSALIQTGNAIESGIEKVEQFYSSSPVEKMAMQESDVDLACSADANASAKENVILAKSCAKIVHQTLDTLEWTYWNMDRFHDPEGVQAIYCAKQRLAPVHAKMKEFKKEMKAAAKTE